MSPIPSTQKSLFFFFPALSLLLFFFTLSTRSASRFERRPRQLELSKALKSGFPFLATRLFSQDPDWSIERERVVSLSKRTASRLGPSFWSRKSEFPFFLAGSRSSSFLYCCYRVSRYLKSELDLTCSSTGNPPSRHLKDLSVQREPRASVSKVCFHFHPRQRSQH